MESQPFVGSSAIVTGGGSGIGLACAIRLASDGAAVTIVGRSRDRLEAGADAIESATGRRPSMVAGDVADEETLRTSVARAEDDGPLAAAVLSAGTGTVGPLVSLTAEQWRTCLEVNLTGAFFAIKHAGAAMARGGGGSIVAISSIAAPLTHRLMTPYCVSKAALEALVRGAADELGGSGVRVNAVRPGLVPTELAEGLAGTPAVRDDYLQQMPLGRLGTVEDIAAGVGYLTGPESSWVTGQCFAIDGGHTLRRGPNLVPVLTPVFGEDAIAGRIRP